MNADLARTGSTRAAIAGPYGPAQMACLASWIRSGITPLFAHTTEGPALRGASARLHGYRRFSEAAFSHPEGADSIVRWAGEQGADLLVAVSYEATLMIAKAVGRSGMAMRSAPLDESLLELLRTKSAQLDLAASIGFRCDEHWLLETADEARGLPLGAAPFVLRPDKEGAGPAGLKARFVRNAADAERYVASLDGGFRLIAQRFRPAANLVIHGSRLPDGSHGPLACFVADYKFEGVTQRLRRETLPEAMAGKCRDFVAAAGHIGVYHFELLLAEPLEDSRFLEINARLGGTTGKALALGYDEPAHLLRTLGADVRTADVAAAPGARASNRIALAKRFVQALRGADDPLNYPRLGRLETLANLGLGMTLWRDELTYRRPLWLVSDYVREMRG